MRHLLAQLSHTKKHIHTNTKFANESKKRPANERNRFRATQLMDFENQGTNDDCEKRKHTKGCDENRKIRSHMLGDDENGDYNYDYDY